MGGSFLRAIGRFVTFLLVGSSDGAMSFEERLLLWRLIITCMLGVLIVLSIWSFGFMGVSSGFATKTMLRDTEFDVMIAIEQSAETARELRVDLLDQKLTDAEAALCELSLDANGDPAAVAQLKEVYWGRLRRDREDYLNLTGIAYEIRPCAQHAVRSMGSAP